MPVLGTNETSLRDKRFDAKKKYHTSAATGNRIGKDTALPQTRYLPRK